MLCFSAHKFFTNWWAPFVIEFLISRSWLCLRSMCSVHRLLKPKKVLGSPEFGSREHISDIKLFGSKMFLCDAISHSDVVFLISPQTFSSPRWKRSISLLGVPRRVKRVLAFPQMFTLDSGSFVQLL